MLRGRNLRSRASENGDILGRFGLLGILHNKNLIVEFNMFKVET